MSRSDGRGAKILQSFTASIITARSRPCRHKRGGRGVPCSLGHFGRVFLFLLPAFSFSLLRNKADCEQRAKRRRAGDGVAVPFNASKQAEKENAELLPIIVFM